MKYCPTCETRYDEDILRFCMKDGTPLIDEDDEPNFIAMPSESLEHAEDDEPEDVTIVRKSTPPIQPPAAEPVDPPPTPQPRPDAGARIVVSTEPETPRPAAQGYRAASPEPPRSNTVTVVILTIFGTLFVLAIGALGFWGLQKLAGGSDANSNVNANANFANENTNVDTNLGIDSNFNFNTNGGFDTNANSNSNDRDKTPTPTPTASPTPRPTPSPTATPDRDDDNGDDDDTPQPTPTPVRVRTPAPTPTPLIIRPAPETRRTPNVRRRDDDQ